MSQHTPGPWEAVRNHDAYVRSPNLVEHRIDQAAGHPNSLAVALVIADCPRLRDTGQAAANARLIAKSPEMYGFIESAANDFAHDTDRDEACRPNCRACRAARIIADVEGRP